MTDKTPTCDTFSCSDNAVYEIESFDYPGVEGKYCEEHAQRITDDFIDVVKEPL
jgi:hypothetical protein